MLSFCQKFCRECRLLRVPTTRHNPLRTGIRLPGARDKEKGEDEVSPPTSGDNEIKSIGWSIFAVLISNHVKFPWYGNQWQVCKYPGSINWQKPWPGMGKYITTVLFDHPKWIIKVQQNLHLAHLLASSTKPCHANAWATCFSDLQKAVTQKWLGEKGGKWYVTHPP